MNSQGTIQGHICPVTIHFPAYRKKSTFQTVRRTSVLLPMVHVRPTITTNS